MKSFRHAAIQIRGGMIVICVYVLNDPCCFLRITVYLRSQKKPYWELQKSRMHRKWAVSRALLCITAIISVFQMKLLLLIALFHTSIISFINSENISRNNR
jgi:hypothetical protein